MSELNNTKKPNQSLTIIASKVGSTAQITAIILIVLQYFGYDLTEGEADAIVTGITAVIGLVMHLLAIHGRKRAKTKIVK